MEESKLLGLLEKHQVPVRTWGKGKARKVEELMAELMAGGASTGNNRVGLVRLVRVAAVSVCYTLDGPPHLQLKAKKANPQSCKEYPWSMNGVSLYEKLLRGEDALDAAMRVLGEFGISGKLSSTFEAKTVWGPKDSIVYPGLQDRFEKVPVSMFLPRYFYHPKGYRAEGNRAARFVWVES